MKLSSVNARLTEAPALIHSPLLMHYHIWMTYDIIKVDDVFDSGDDYIIIDFRDMHRLLRPKNLDIALVTLFSL